MNAFERMKMVVDESKEEKSRNVQEPLFTKTERTTLRFDKRNIKIIKPTSFDATEL